MFGLAERASHGVGEGLGLLAALAAELDVADSTSLIKDDRPANPDVFSSPDMSSYPSLHQLDSSIPVCAISLI